MRFGPYWRRFNPFGAEALAASEVSIDPRQMNALLGALAALEVFLGVVLALPFVSSVVFGIIWLRMRPYQRELHHLQHVNGWAVFSFCGATLLSAALLWAGIALLLGHRSRHRAHGALALSLFVVAVVSALAAVVT